MPFPDVNSDLALIRHYYICHSNVQNNKILFKCQTHKATMIAKCVEEIKSSEKVIF